MDKKSDSNIKVTTLRVPRDVFDTISKWSKLNGTSFNKAVIAMLKIAYMLMEGVDIDESHKI